MAEKLIQRARWTVYTQRAVDESSPFRSGFQQNIFGFSDGKMNNENEMIIAHVASRTKLKKAKKRGENMKNLAFHSLLR